jgi:hypothetical protein
MARENGLVNIKAKAGRPRPGAGRPKTEAGSRETEAGRPKQGEWKQGTKRGKPENQHQDPFIEESNLKNPAVQDATLSLYITLNSRHKARILRVCSIYYLRLLEMDYTH